MFDFPVAFLESNDGTAILAFGDGPTLSHGNNGMSSIDSFVESHQGHYIFSCLSYDLKNQLENLTSVHEDKVGFPEVVFWVPECVVLINGAEFNFVQGSKNEMNSKILDDLIQKRSDQEYAPIHFDMRARTSKADYIQHVKDLKQEIQLGNIYEVNYCQEFFAENVELGDPLKAYFKLNALTKAPYSSYFSIGDHTVLGGSPELYIAKEGNRVSSSPIKGTRKRSANSDEDEALKKELLADQKERSENVMIVDLVRNDLSKIATKGSVHVDELFGVYSFKTVHQLISTISCKVDDSTSFTDVINATFPMGSMTGAPKISAMKIIEEHEEFKRGLYSGSIGFIAPNGDFTFNVVIRTLIYNHLTQYLSCAVGGAITINSDPEMEYEECLVKVKVILDGMNA
ncbi:MAG: anthranilate synthase component I family protein [Crocinitomicaceae bacterium]|nr:anthranilate synthase component I family protein [Crocinitomicaceae bacterium]